MKRSIPMVLSLVVFQVECVLVGQAQLGPEFGMDAPVPVPVSAVQPVVCQCRDGFLAVWNGAGTRLSSSGEPLDLPAFRFTESQATWFPAVAWNGQSALVLQQVRIFA
ncbi:MAG: hypothetical protein HY735_00775 [Verrucomicrobia bacterium]|nr:hypothetical protein [Verrucomicrobiota bacterium]